jgi:predicted permease
MFDLDEYKAKWAEHDKKLDEILLLNRRMLETAKLNKSRSALRRMKLFAGLETAGWLAIVMWLGSFIYSHWGAWRMVAMGVACDLYAISMMAGTIRVVAEAQQVDYDGPVAAIQKQLEKLRMVRIRLTQWGVLAGVVMWAPFAVVVVNTLFSAAWLAANVLFGMALALLLYQLSKRCNGRLQRAPFIQRMMRDIGGHSLAAAEGYIGDLAKWQAS